MLKKFTKKALQTWGYRIVKSTTWTDLLPARRDHLSFALASVFPSLMCLRLLQIGANDGSHADPVSGLIDKYNWSAVFVEGDPRMADLLREMRGDEARFKVVNTLISDEDGSAEFYTLKADKLPAFAQGLGTLSKERIEQAQRDLSEYRPEIVTRRLECISMQTFLGAAGCDFDVCVIDVEGLDLSILKWLVAERALPKVVYYEHACLSKEDAGVSFALLREQQYNLLVDDSDCVAYRL
jgi:FkbM family methyltransferase